VTVAVLIAATTVTAGAAKLPALAATPPVTISDPPAGIRGRPYLTSVIDLSPYRYQEHEYLVSGVARTYPTGGAGPTTAPYTTRVIVRRPAKKTAFNGTVDAEWFNVTFQVDIDFDWGEAYRLMLADRYAYVGISAQAAGVHSLQVWDPVRYASLSHPGDDYSFDIYAQVLAAVRAGRLLGDLNVKHIIATGHSQSGFRLHTFVETVQPQTRSADGFLIRGNSQRTWAAEPSVPVLHFMTESEVSNFGTPANGLFRDDSDHYRLWQLAGAAHLDNWSNTYWLQNEMPRDWAGQPVTWDERSAGVYGEEGGVGNCDAMLSKTSEFTLRYAVDDAVVLLDRWIRGKGRPPSMPRLELNASGTIVRDQHGNALGGVRYPVVDVPVATYSGEGGCFLSGSTHRFDPATLRSLYPTHHTYVTAVDGAIDRARHAQLLLPMDTADFAARAAAAPIPPP